jgi:hypothetical protein
MGERMKEIKVRNEKKGVEERVGGVTIRWTNESSGKGKRRTSEGDKDTR